MSTDAELLRQFVSQRAEDAFAELVNRHIDVVYSAACREMRGDVSAAEDVTQLVFIELVRKAPTLPDHPTLAGWLYTCVRYVSANLRRADRRRKMRDEEARAMNELTQPNANDPMWQEIRPVLDDAMHELDEADRDAVLLRFFEGKSLREVGAALCLTENAARMRVDRALEKLRRALVRRRVNSTSSALASALAVGMVAAPPALMAMVTRSALAAASISAASTPSLLGAMTMTKTTMAGLGALAVAAVSVLLWQQQLYSRLADESEVLQGKLRQVAVLRQENQILADELRAADKRKQEEHFELLRLRGQAGVALRLKAEEEQMVAETNSWRQQFDAAYKLRDGEVLRRISPPFIPERDEYCRQEDSAGNHGYLIFVQDERGLRERSFAFVIGKNFPHLENVLGAVLRMSRYEFYGADELLASTLPGDWVLRKGVSLESQLTALEPILHETTGRHIRFEKQWVTNDVVIVRGRTVPGKEQIIDVFAENRNYFSGGGICRGTFERFLEYLGDRLNVRFASEVQAPNQASLCCWTPHPDSDCLHAGDRRGEIIGKVLGNLGKQTSLSFSLRRTPALVWCVKELGSTGVNTRLSSVSGADSRN